MALLPLGAVATLYADGIVGPAVGLTWPSDNAYEYEYTPDGTPSGLCMGVAVTAANGTPVTLQPCGITAKTVWITLSIDTIGGEDIAHAAEAGQQEARNQRAELAVQLGQLLAEEAKLAVAVQQLQARKARIYWSGLQGRDGADPFDASGRPLQLAARCPPLPDCGSH